MNTIRSSLFVLGTIGCLYALPSSLSAAESSRPERRVIQPALSADVLFNPGMGLYLAGGSGLRYQPPADAWALSLCDIVYFRPDWNDSGKRGARNGIRRLLRPDL